MNTPPSPPRIEKPLVRCSVRMQLSSEKKSFHEPLFPCRSFSPGSVYKSPPLVRHCSHLAVLDIGRPSGKPLYRFLNYREKQKLRGEKQLHGYIPTFYQVFFFLLPSDYVQHDLQHGSFITFPKKENLRNKKRKPMHQVYLPSVLLYCYLWSRVVTAQPFNPTGGSMCTTYTLYERDHTKK